MLHYIVIQMSSQNRRNLTLIGFYPKTLKNGTRMLMFHFLPVLEIVLVSFFSFYISLIQFNFSGQKFAILEEKAILASVIRSYKFTAVEKIEDVKILAELIQRPKNGIKLNISKRG